MKERKERNDKERKIKKYMINKKTKESEGRKRKTWGKKVRKGDKLGIEEMWRRAKKEVINKEAKESEGEEIETKGK